MTNPDCYSLLPKIKYRREVFIPFIVETDRYKPTPVSRNGNEDALTFFHPTRHVWNVKGNDRLLRAFAKFVAQGYKSRLVMIDWGTMEDAEQSKALVKTLGIDRYVEWLSPVSKPRLIQLYNQSDVVFDQFILGSYGTTAPEAMGCGRPVVMYLDEYWNKKCYGRVAPVLNAQTVDEILEAMLALTDRGLRRKLGEEARNYVVEHHSPPMIARQYIELYREVLE